MLGVSAFVVFAVPHGTSAASGPTPVNCGNITVKVTPNTPTQLCPGGPTITVTQKPATTLPTPASGAILNSLTPEGCETDMTLSNLVPGSANITVKTVELFNLQPYSNIDPGYANPPYTELDIPTADTILGFGSGSTSGYTNVSAWFNSVAIAQLETHSTFTFSWQPIPLIPSPGQLASIDYTLTGFEHSNSPGYLTPMCTDGSYSLSESTAYFPGVQAAVDAISDAIAWTWDQAIRGLCLFHC